MSDGRVSIDIDVKYASAIDAFLKLSQKISNTGEQLDKVGAKARENARFLKQLESSFETPQGKYNADSQRLLQLRMQGKVGAEDYSKFQSGLYKRYTQSDPELIAQRKAAEELAASLKRAEQELKRYADRTKEINATPMERYAASVSRAREALKAGHLTQEEFNREVARAGDELHKAGESNEEAFGAKALNMLAGYAAGLLTIQAAISAVRAGYDSLRKAREEAFQSAQTALEANLEATSAGATAEEKSRMLKQFHEMRTMPGAGGYSSEATARGYSRSYQAGFDEKSLRDLFLAAPQVGGDLESLAQMAETARVNFGKEQLSHIQAMNMALSVAKVTQADPRDISKFYGQSLPLLSRGFSYSESLGMESALQTAFGKGATGADRSRALMTKLNEDEQTRMMLEQGDSKGIFELLDRMTTEEWVDRFGKDQEAMSAMYALNKGEVRKIFESARDQANLTREQMEKSPETYIQREAKAIQQTEQIGNQLQFREEEARTEIQRIKTHGKDQTNEETAIQILKRSIDASSTVDAQLKRPLGYIGRGISSVYDTLTRGSSGVTGSVMQQVEDIYISELDKSRGDKTIDDEEQERLDTISGALRSIWKKNYGKYDENKLQYEIDIANFRNASDMVTNRPSDEQINREKSEYLNELLKQQKAQTDATNAMRGAIENADGRTKSAVEGARAAAGRN